jgi:hypothetical protein
VARGRNRRQVTLVPAFTGSLPFDVGLILCAHDRSHSFADRYRGIGCRFHACSRISSSQTARVADYGASRLRLIAQRFRT